MKYSIEIENHIKELLVLSEDDILLHIGIILEPGGALTAPKELRKRVIDFFKKNKKKLAKKCCTTLKQIDGPELDVVPVIFTILIEEYDFTLASAITAYLVRKGHSWLCDNLEKTK